MAIIFRKIKSLSAKKTIGVVLAAGFVALLLSSPFAGASGLEFNKFPVSYTGEADHDLPMLDCRNVTRGEDWSNSQEEHDDGVASNPGDIVECRIYYHNGATDTDENVARGTVVRASASPSLGGEAFSHTISATVGAANAQTVSSSDLLRGGDVQINIPNNENLALSLVPGSTYWFRDCGLRTCRGVGDGQLVGDSLFTSGISIGDIRGCFEFHGFINFKLRVAEREQVGDLHVEKNVKNVTSGVGFTDYEVWADPGDTIEYQIRITAQNSDVDEVNIRDALGDDRLNPIGNVTLDNGQVLDSDDFFSGGARIGTLNAWQTREVRFQVRVADASEFPIDQVIRMSNVAVGFNDQRSAQDDAFVVLRREAPSPAPISCVFTWSDPRVLDGSGRGLRRAGQAANVRQQVTGLSPNQTFDIVSAIGSTSFRSPVRSDANGNYDVFDTTPVPSNMPVGDYTVTIQVNYNVVATCTGFKIEVSPVSQINIEKTVRNDSTGEGFADTVTANPGNTLTFRLVVSPGASNNIIQNVTVRDVLPGRMTFVSGSLNVDGNTTFPPAQFFGSGINIGSISPGSTKTVTFRVTLAGLSEFSPGCVDLTNTGYVTASPNLDHQDTAIARVCVVAAQKPPGTPGTRPTES